MYIITSSSFSLHTTCLSPLSHYQYLNLVWCAYPSSLVVPNLSVTPVLHWDISIQCHICPSLMNDACTCMITNIHTFTLSHLPSYCGIYIQENTLVFHHQEVAHVRTSSYDPLSTLPHIIFQLTNTTYLTFYVSSRHHQLTPYLKKIHKITTCSS